MLNSSSSPVVQLLNPNLVLAEDQDVNMDAEPPRRPADTGDDS